MTPLRLGVSAVIPTLSVPARLINPHRNTPLSHQVFRNLDTLMPALYGQVIPIVVEVVVATVLVCSLYGPIGLVQLALFVGCKDGRPRWGLP